MNVSFPINNTVIREGWWGVGGWSSVAIGSPEDCEFFRTGHSLIGRQSLR